MCKCKLVGLEDTFQVSFCCEKRHREMFILMKTHEYSSNNSTLTCINEQIQEDRRLTCCNPLQKRKVLLLFSKARLVSSTLFYFATDLFRRKNDFLWVFIKDKCLAFLQIWSSVLKQHFTLFVCWHVHPSKHIQPDQVTDSLFVSVQYFEVRFKVIAH